MCLNFFYLACGASCHDVNGFLKLPIGQDSAGVVPIVHEMNHKSKKKIADLKEEQKEKKRAKARENYHLRKARAKALATLPIPDRSSCDNVLSYYMVDEFMQQK